MRESRALLSRARRVALSGRLIEAQDTERARIALTADDVSKLCGISAFSGIKHRLASIDSVTITKELGDMQQRAHARTER